MHAWRERVGIEPTQRHCRDTATDLKSAEATRLPSAPNRLVAGVYLFARAYPREITETLLSAQECLSIARGFVDPLDSDTPKEGPTSTALLVPPLAPQ